MQKIIPHLWFDNNAMEAVKLYVSLFEDSSIVSSVTIEDTPSGDAQTVEFKLANLEFAAINGGPYFTFNPSASLMVSCDTAEEVDRLYENLSQGGTDLMPLGEYPFSKRYVWVQDKFGLSWQLMLMEGHEKIRPSLLFAGDACGKAEEAMEYYLSVFKNSSKGHVDYYGEGDAEDKRAKLAYSDINLEGNELILMDHGMGGDFTFSGAFSLMVMCKDQEEIDYFWEKLSFVPEAEQCGWLVDQFGVSWQIVPENFNDVYMTGTEEEIKRVTEAFMQMKKFDLAALEKARLG